jgi:hypothetical protein
MWTRRRSGGGAGYEIKTRKPDPPRVYAKPSTQRNQDRRPDQESQVRSRDSRWPCRRGPGKVEKTGKASGLRKRHALQGPIDDAFLDPFPCCPARLGRP